MNFILYAMSNNKGYHQISSAMYSFQPCFFLCTHSTLAYTKHINFHTTQMLHACVYTYAYVHTSGTFMHTCITEKQLYIRCTALSVSFQGTLLARVHFYYNLSLKSFIYFDITGSVYISIQCLRRMEEGMQKPICFRFLTYAGYFAGYFIEASDKLCDVSLFVTRETGSEEESSTITPSNRLKCHHTRVTPHI